MRKAVLKGFSRSLRRDQTDAEKKLWWYLRARQFLGFKFKRQQVLGPYIADFCSFEARVIIELDGSQHLDRQTEDQERTKYLEERGY